MIGVVFCLFSVTKAESRRTIIEHIDQRNWRALDYFRMVENKRKLQGQNVTSLRRTSVRIPWSSDCFSDDILRID